MRVWWPGQDRHVVQDRKRKDRMKRAASIAATTSSPIASVCCFQLPRHLFLPVGVEKDRESSIAQTIMVYEYAHGLVVLWQARDEVYETGRRMDEKEECGRPGRPSLPSPDRSVPYCRVHHAEDSESSCYISIFRCAGVRLKSRVAVTVSLTNHQKIES
jgi:hypothetical protein